ncbi:MAG: class I SAM-dependent methyltransferase [Anaerolineaceae bacterium]|nr:class I SAM-dependent methyltransferase [Anaerolineaceae bacterium]
MTMIPTNDYEQQLAGEAELWGTDAERQAQETPPDWRYHRSLRHNIIYHQADIDAFLEHVQPSMATLELGCASGWLTLAMAQRGANATGMDISDKALNVARRYYETIQETVNGSVTYEVADLNTLELPAATYDVIAVKGTLHHLVRMDHVIAQIYKALKPGGLLWASDSHGEESLPTVLVASGLMFLLPTQVSYGEKLRGLLRFGLKSPSRIKASIEAEGLSPFEGAGREHDWVKLIGERFTVERRVDSPAVTGYITHQVKLPDWAALPLLHGLCAVDRLLVRFKLLRNTGVILYARKTAGEQ